MDAMFFAMSRFNNFLLIDSTDRSKISSNHHRIIFDVSQYPLSFFAKTSSKKRILIDSFIWLNTKKSAKKYVFKLVELI